MSYNIDTVKATLVNARIAEMLDDARALVNAGKGDEEMALTDFQWQGEWSGNSMDFFKREVAPKIKGSVEAIFTWEGGDSVSGMLIEDGVVTECEVEMKIVRPK